MRKRVGLARAIVGQPEILLYDEPVTGLDPVNTAGVDQLITRHRASAADVTSIVVTHDIEGALLVCDRVALLEGGQLRFIGTPEEFRDSDGPLVRAFADRDARPPPRPARWRRPCAAPRGDAAIEERHP